MENKFFIDISRFDKERNKLKLNTLKNHLLITEDIKEADYILALGGDGCLLNSVYQYKHLNKPFFCINGGTVGYFMQDLMYKNGEFKDIDILEKIKFNQFPILKLPLFNIRCESVDGEIIETSVFADTWIERANAQCLKYSIGVEDKDKSFFCSNDKIISGDGILISSGAGSTGYYKVIADTVLPLGTNNLGVAPMNSTVDKRKLTSFILQKNQTLHVEITDTDFRVPKFILEGKDILNKDGKSFIPKKLEVTSSDRFVEFAHIEKDYLHKKSFNYLIN